MSGVFGERYARVYDALYADKNYADECNAILRACPARSVLDLGCGSGGHAVPLAQLGLTVVGVDRSEPMLREARAKANSAGVSDHCAFQQADIRCFRTEQAFDAALLMFAVLGYQTEHADAIAALRTARKHLHPGGHVLFDFWYGPAVLAQLPSDRTRVRPLGDGEVKRRTSTTIDIQRQICHVHFRVESGHAQETFEETHTMRFFFPREIELLLDAAGFRLARLGSFPDFERDPSEETWNVTAIGVAQ